MRRLAVGTVAARLSAAGAPARSGGAARPGGGRDQGDGADAAVERCGVGDGRRTTPAVLPGAGAARRCRRRTRRGGGDVAARPSPGAPPRESAALGAGSGRMGPEDHRPARAGDRNGGKAHGADAGDAASRMGPESLTQITIITGRGEMPPQRYLALRLLVNLV